MSRSSTVDVTLSVTDRITGPIKAIQNRIDRLTAPVRRVARVIGDFGRAAGIDKLAGRFSNLGSEISGVAGRVSILSAGLAGVAAIGIGAGLSSFITSNAEMEKFGSILESVMGSSDKASEALDWVSQFAKETPYQLGEVTDSFVKLTSYGIDPIAGSLKAAGDAAAAMGRPIGDAVEAIADAMTGENERLKGFGITTETTGNKIRYNWSENGKQMTAVANKNSRKQIEAVIKGIWNRQYGGAAKKLSRTWDGMISELGDTWSRFMLQIGNSGSFDKLKGLLTRAIGWVDRMTSTGKLNEWAGGISDALSSVTDELGKFLFGYNILGDSMKDGIHVPGFLEELPSHLKTAGDSIRGLVTGFRDFYAAMKPAIDFVGGPGNAALIALGAITFAPLAASLVTLGVALGGLITAVSLPVLAVIAAFALLGAAVYALYQKFDEFKAYWANLWTRVGDAFNESWTTGVLSTLNEFNPVKHILVGMNSLFEYFTGIDLLAEGDRIIASLASGIAAGAGKLYEAGAAAVQGLLDGIAAKFEELKAYISTAIADIAAMMPDWAQGAIGGIGQSLAAPGLSSGDLPAAGGGLSLKRYMPRTPNLLDEPGPLNLPGVAALAAPSSSSSISTTTVDASTITIGSADFPEPIIANQPQNVTAVFNAGGVVVNANGLDAAQAKAVTLAVLAEAAREHAAQVRSRLND